MSLGRIISILPLLILAGAGTAEASTDTGAGGALLEFVGLFLAFGCFLVSWKVFSYVRGGRLASAWQWLTSAFFLFAASQALALLVYLTLLPVTNDLVILLRTLGLVLLLLGMIKMRKALA